MQNMYIKHLYISRQEYLRKEIAGLWGNTKHLYKLITELRGTVSENPLPECENDEKLENRFFVDKIKKKSGIILTHVPNMIISWWCNIWYECILWNWWNHGKESDHQTQMKSCELDITPTYILKK